MAEYTTESPAARLDGEIRRAGEARRVLLATIAGLLLAMKRGRHFLTLGFSSLADYAAARLEFSAWKTRDLVELSERAESLPRIREAFEGGVVHWTKLRAIARVATAESESEWLARAAELSARQLERAVAEAEGEKAPKVKVVLELDPEEYADLEDATREVRRERAEGCSREQAILELVRRGLGAAAGSARPPFQTVLYRCEDCDRVRRETRQGPIAVEPATEGRAGCDSDLVDARRPGRLARTIPPAVRRHVLARERGRCAVPRCPGRDFVEVHHVTPRSEGGTHDPRSLTVLCSRHHAAVHEGTLRIEGTAPELRFFRGDGTEITSARGDVPDPPAPPLSERACRLLGALGEEPTALDDVAIGAGMPISEVFSATTELELAGLARRSGGALTLSRV